MMQLMPRLGENCQHPLRREPQFFWPAALTPHLPRGLHDQPQPGDRGLQSEQIASPVEVKPRLGFVGEIVYRARSSFRRREARNDQREEVDGDVRGGAWRMVGGLGVEEDAPAAAW